MAEKKYEVVYTLLPKQEAVIQGSVPIIIPFVPHDDPEIASAQQPVSWRDAKKEVRQFFISQIAELRQFKEKDLLEKVTS